MADMETRAKLEKWLPPVDRCVHLMWPVNAEGWWDSRQCPNKALAKKRYCLAHFELRLALPIPPDDTGNG